MTSSDDLSPEAKHLLRQAKGADGAKRSEVNASVQRFRSYRAIERAPQLRATPRRATPWAVFIAVLSGTLGAYATVGQSLGLPVPDWWPEFALMPAPSDATAERATGGQPTAVGVTASAAPPSDVPGSTEPSAASLVPGSSVSDDLGQSPEPAAAPTPNVTAAPSNLEGERWARAKALTSTRGVTAPTATPKPRTTVDAVWPSQNDGANVSLSPTVGPLAREVQSITAARDALNAGNYALAQRHLTDHQQAFPSGALAEERRALSAICQCRQGQGTRAAEAYVARRPNSPLGRRVATECSLDVRQ